MTRIVLALATAASFSTMAPLLVTTPANAQVDVQIGHDHDRYRDHDRPGVVIGQRPHCRMVTITERHGDRTVTRTERRCD